jgi:hypothetical protein
LKFSDLVIWYVKKIGDVFEKRSLIRFEDFFSNKNAIRIFFVHILQKLSW